MVVFVCTKSGESARAITDGIFSAGADARVFDNWQAMFGASIERPCDAMVADLSAIIDVPEELSPYEEFANSKMEDSILKPIPLILISMPPGSEPETFVGWPGFLAAFLRHPPDPLAVRRVLASLLERRGDTA